MATRFGISDVLPGGAATHSILGWVVGCEVRTRLDERWAFETGVHVVRKGGRETYSGPWEVLGFTLQADLQATTRVAYLVLPLRIKLMSTSRVKPYMRFGVDLGAVVSSRTHLVGTVTGNAGTARLDQERGADTEPFDVGFAFDVGVDFPLEGVRAFVELNGALGATDVADAPSTVRNQMLGIVFGIAVGADLRAGTRAGQSGAVTRMPEGSNRAAGERPGVRITGR